MLRRFFFSTFVGYGQPDINFAERLVRDLTRNGVNCWLYSMDRTPGRRTWTEIGESRRQAERVIFLCSVRSLIRDGLLHELEAQIDETPEKIIPISLDKIWMESGFKVMRAGRDLKPFLIERNYADFSEGSNYEYEFNRLQKALQKKQ